MEKTKGEITRERVLKAARVLINQNGFNNTSISDIINATGVKKGNLYFHFESKEKLGLALVEYAKNEYLTYLTKNMKGNTPLEKIDSLLNAIYNFHAEKKFIGGCIFGNIALEMSDSYNQYSNLIKEVFEEWISLLSGLLKAAINSRDLNINIQPGILARHIVASLEGGIMMARLSKNGDDFLDCIKSIRILLGITQKVKH